MVSVSAPNAMAASPGATPTPTPTPANQSNDNQDAFARQLERAAHDSDAAQQRAADAARRSAANDSAHAPQPDKAQQRRSKGGAGTEDDKVAGRPAADKAPDHKSDDSATGDLSAMLAGLMGHQATQPPMAGADTKALPAASARVSRAAAQAAQSGAAGGDASAAGKATAADAQASPDSQATLPSMRAEAAAFMLPNTQPASVHAAAGEPPATGATPTYQAQIHAAVSTPEFAPGLSAEVNVMLRDGVQQARLHLNPAEMGPITVQIQIDAGNAQVHMTAENAATRQALEQAMPDLAGTLREHGLTLTGGGVFEQAQQQGADEGASSRSGSANNAATGADSPLAAPMAPSRRVAAPGAIDLYA